MEKEKKTEKLRRDSTRNILASSNWKRIANHALHAHLIGIKFLTSSFLWGEIRHTTRSTDAYPIHDGWLVLAFNLSLKIIRCSSRAARRLEENSLTH